MKMHTELDNDLMYLRRCFCRRLNISLTLALVRSLRRNSAEKMNSHWTVKTDSIFDDTSVLSNVAVCRRCF